MRGWQSVVIAALGGLLCVASPAAAQTTISYNPGLGTLPQAQGFGYAHENVTNPASVSGGILHQGPNATEAHEYWARADTPFDFDNGFEFKVNLKVVSSGYVPDAVGAGEQRAGYQLTALDSQSRVFLVGIAANGFFVSNDVASPIAGGIPFTAFDATSDFHEYKLVVSGGTGRFFIDGRERGSLAVGANSGLGFGSLVAFGDDARSVGSETDLAGFSYTVNADGASAVPEPGALALFLPVLGLLIYQRPRVRTSKAR